MSIDDSLQAAEAAIDKLSRDMSADDYQEFLGSLIDALQLRLEESEEESKDKENDE